MASKMTRDAERARLGITTPVDPKHDEKYGHLANDDTAERAEEGLTRRAEDAGPELTDRPAPPRGRAPLTPHA